VLLQRRRSLPFVDAAKLRADIDDMLDPTLSQRMLRATGVVCSIPAQ
jgi:hypothetical protein